MRLFIRCDFSAREILMSSLCTTEKAICLSFVVWLVSSFFYSLMTLRLKPQLLRSQINGSVFTASHHEGFQKERGGVRRTVGSNGRNISKDVKRDISLKNT